jgi:hypothetical protein
MYSFDGIDLNLNGSVVVLRSIIDGTSMLAKEVP